MKRILLFLLLTCTSVCFAAPAENELYFRAMKDEMNRSLKELHLPGEVKPFYVAYWIDDRVEFRRKASLGTLLTVLPLEREVLVQGVIDVGSEKDNSRGFARSEERSMPGWWTPVSYEGLRTQLWKLSNRLYLEALERHKQKKAYLRTKNIQNKLPDWVPAKQSVSIEGITPWQQPDSALLEAWLQKVSAWGKEVKFLEDFSVLGKSTQEDYYFLNSRGGKFQTTLTENIIIVWAEFRQPDGYKEEKSRQIVIKDFSSEELTAAELKIQGFLTELQAQYGAKTGEAYVGPVLYKPAAAKSFLRKLLLSDLNKTVPFFVQDRDEDSQASPWRKKIGQRILSPGIMIYDRPQETVFEGVSLAHWYVDLEGVAAQELLLVGKNGRLEQLPLGQRPLTKKHASNGHVFWTEQVAPREGLSNVFIEPEHVLTDAQMEARLLSRCRELELEYCYIAHTSSDFERIYTKDGRKEYIVGLQDTNLSARSLRDIEAAGGKRELFLGTPNLVTPSLLVNEVEVIPQDRKPGRKPFIAKP